jgi:hypothetical protein
LFTAVLALEEQVILDGKLALYRSGKNSTTRWVFRVTWVDERLASGQQYFFDSQPHSVSLVEIVCVGQGMTDEMAHVAGWQLCVL